MRPVETHTEQLKVIRAWYERHKHDYDPRDVKMPPKVWAEYFAWLLEHAEAANAVDPVGGTGN